MLSLEEGYEMLPLGCFQGMEVVTHLPPLTTEHRRPNQWPGIVWLLFLLSHLVGHKLSQLYLLRTSPISLLILFLCLRSAPHLPHPNVIQSSSTLSILFFTYNQRGFSQTHI